MESDLVLQWRFISLQTLETEEAVRWRLISSELAIYHLLSSNYILVQHSGGSFISMAK